MYRQQPQFQQPVPQQPQQTLTPQQMAEQLQHQRQMQLLAQQPLPQQPLPQVPLYAQQPVPQQTQAPLYAQQPVPQQTQVPLYAQQPVPQQPQQAFGHQQVPEREIHGSGGSIRSRKSRVSTVAQQRPPEVPLTRDITGTTAYAESSNIDSTEQVLKEGSKMSDLNVSALVHDESTTALPVPDVNIVGDVIYACLRAAADADESTFDAVHRDDDAGYMFYVPGGNVHKLEAKYVDVNSFMAALATDLATGSPIAKYIDKRLTMLFNTVLHDIIGSKATVDSVGIDWLDMNKYAKANFSEDALHQYAELIDTISKISSTVTLKTEEDEATLVRLFIKETYVVIDTNTSDALNLDGIGNDEAFITVESTPVVHKALSEVLEHAPSITYLLTDTYKYLLATVASSGKISIKSVCAK